jgi:hypothetical protein
MRADSTNCASPFRYQMGFESAELLKLIIRKTPPGKKGGGLLMIQKPHLVVLDLMCSIHRLSSFKGTIIELYNVLMEQVRIWLIDHKTPIVWISIDKGVPAYKTRKANNKANDEKGPRPYPKHTIIDEYGRLVFCTPVSDHAESGVKFRIDGSSDTIEVDRLLCSERRLRRCLFDFFGTLARGETKNVPAGSKLIISYSLDKALSPIVITSTDYQRGVAEYYNDLMEADWDMQRAITQLSREMPARSATLVCSVDGDMLGILGYGVVHAKRKYPDRAGPVYFYNMNQTVNGRTIEMNDFVEGILYEHSMTIAGFCCCCSCVAMTMFAKPGSRLALVLNTSGMPSSRFIAIPPNQPMKLRPLHLNPMRPKPRPVGPCFHSLHLNPVESREPFRVLGRTF